MGIGDRIKAVRLKRGLTQKQLGELCGMADSAIRRYESGRGNPTEKTIQRIADALLIRVSDLVDPLAYDLGFKEGSDAEEWQNRLIDEFWKKEGYTYSDCEINLINVFSGLDDAGQGKVVEYAKDLLPKHRRQESPEPPPAPPEGKDTPAPPEGTEGPQKPPKKES